MYTFLNLKWIQVLKVLKSVMILCLQYMSCVVVRLAPFMEEAFGFYQNKIVYAKMMCLLASAGVNSCRSWSQPQSELHHQLDVMNQFFVIVGLTFSWLFKFQTGTQ